MIESWIHSLFVEPLSYPTQGDKRVYWVFLLSALLMACFHLWRQRHEALARSLLPSLLKLLHPASYLHRSTLTDLKWLVLNHSVRTLVLLPLLASQLSGAIWVNASLYQLWGDGRAWQLNPIALCGLFTLCIFMVDDLSRFALHLAMHRVPWLWYFHQTHHSATTLTPLTLYRLHTVEMALLTLRNLLVLGGVSGVFVYVFKGQISAWDILGANACSFVFNLLGANLRHSPIPFSFGVFERWFISPAQHQIHHSRAQTHWDKNFGSCLAIWDRLAGSWVPGSAHQKLEFGLDVEPKKGKQTENLFARANKAA